MECSKSVLLRDDRNSATVTDSKFVITLPRKVMGFPRDLSHRDAQVPDLACSPGRPH